MKAKQIKKTPLKLLAIALLISSSSIAQNSINTTGNTTVTPIMEHTYSIGEMAVINTATSSNVIITHGLLQPTESSNATIAYTPMAVLQEVQVYPNPSSSIVNTTFTIAQAGDVSISILDQTGKQVYNQTRAYTAGTYTLPIVIEALPVGIYNLNLTNLTINTKQQYNCKISKR